MLEEAASNSGTPGTLGDVAAFIVSTPEACHHGHAIADWRGGRVSEFFEIVFGLPTVIFTAALAISLGFFLITFLFGVGEGGGGDFDIDAGGGGGGDLDIEVDAGGSDAGSSDGAEGDNTGALAGLLQAANLHILPLALTFAIISLVGWFISAVGTLLLTSDNSPDIVTALRNFGQAEVVDAERSTHLIQVRCEIDNDLRSGMRALIVDVDDDGRFIVSPDVKDLV